MNRGNMRSQKGSTGFFQRSQNSIPAIEDSQMPTELRVFLSINRVIILNCARVAGSAGIGKSARGVGGEIGGSARVVPGNQIRFAFGGIFDFIWRVWFLIVK